jgi:hypothetical protein
MRLEVEELESRIVLNGSRFLLLFSPAQTNSAHVAAVRSAVFVDSSNPALNPELSDGNEGPPGLNRPPSPHTGHLLQEFDLKQAPPPERGVPNLRITDVDVFVTQSPGEPLPLTESMMMMKEAMTGPAAIPGPAAEATLVINNSGTVSAILTVLLPSAEEGFGNRHGPSLPVVGTTGTRQERVSGFGEVAPRSSIQLPGSGGTEVGNPQDGSVADVQARWPAPQGSEVLTPSGPSALPMPALRALEALTALPTTGRAALEIAMRQFLDELDGIGPLNGISPSLTTPANGELWPWLLASGLLAVACEIARRQLRLAGMSPVESDSLPLSSPTTPFEM